MNVRVHKYLLCVPMLLLAVSVSAAQADKETPVEKIRKVLDQPITLNFSGQDFQDICNHLKDKTGVNFVLDQNLQQLMQIGIGNIPAPPGFPAAPALELKGDKTRLSEVLQRFLGTSAMTYVIADNSIVFVTEDQAASRVFGQRIHVKVEEVPLQKVLKEVMRNAHFNLVIDPRVSKEAQNPVTLQLENTTLETSVKLLAELAGLKAVRMDNVLFITNEARADKMRQENPVAPANPANRVFPGMFGGIGLGVVPAVGVAQPIRIQVKPAAPPAPDQNAPK